MPCPLTKFYLLLVYRQNYPGIILLCPGPASVPLPVASGQQVNLQGSHSFLEIDQIINEIIYKIDQIINENRQPRKIDHIINEIIYKNIISILMISLMILVITSMAFLGWRKMHPISRWNIGCNEFVF